MIYGESGTPGGRQTEDRVFLMSLADIDKYYELVDVTLETIRKTRLWADKLTPLFHWMEFYPDLVEGIKGLTARYTGTATWWWLRSPGLSNYHAALVHIDGIVYFRGGIVCSASGGVRPALWLNL